jgi:hypothetical protein
MTSAFAQRRGPRSALGPCQTRQGLGAGVLQAARQRLQLVGEQMGADLPAPGAPRQPVGAVGPGRQPPLPHRHLRCPHREGSRGAVAARPTRRRAGLRRRVPATATAERRLGPTGLLEVDSRRRSDVPRWTPGQKFWVSGLRCYAPARPSAPFARSDRLGARRGVPQDELNAGQSPHPPEVHCDPPAAAGAARRLGRRPDPLHVTQGVRAGRVNTLAIWRR